MRKGRQWPGLSTGWQSYQFASQVPPRRRLDQISREPLPQGYAVCQDCRCSRSARPSVLHCHCSIAGNAAHAAGQSAPARVATRITGSVPSRRQGPDLSTGYRVHAVACRGPERPQNYRVSGHALHVHPCCLAIEREARPANRDKPARGDDAPRLRVYGGASHFLGGCRLTGGDEHVGCHAVFLGRRSRQ